MSKLPYIIVAVALVAVALFSSIFIVNAREQAIVLRFGEIKRVVQEPGAYFKVPLLDTVQILEDRILDLAKNDIRVQVRDGRRYLVDAFIAYRITNPRQFRETVAGNINIANENLGTRLESALRRVYGQRSFEAALSAQRAEMMRDVRDQLRPLAADIGINIVDVRIKRTDLLPEVSQRTFDRMKAERLAEAAELRALGTQEKLRIQAEADREATVTIAEAQRDADILRGEGDAERNRVFAEAFQKDPDFFAFYRSMKAYETAIEGSGTTMLLSPDSQFFEFFKDSQGGVGADVSGGQTEGRAPVGQ